MSHSIGIDAGSRFAKAVLMCGNVVTDKRKMDTGAFYREPSVLVAGWPDAAIVVTGYGRERSGRTVDIMPEIHAHCLGAVHQTGLESFILLDLGGQDTKVAQVRAGKIRDFITNDKCAASCGRTVENLSRVLGMSYLDMLDAADEPVLLTSTCAVFAESEAIGLLAEGIEPKRIAAGIVESLARRLFPDIESMGVGTIVFVGGLTEGRAIPAIIHNQFNTEIVVPQLPDYNAAVGCAVQAAKIN